MERLKPIELHRLELKKSFLGYKTKPVDEILLRATKEIEFLLEKVKNAEETAEKVILELEKYRKQEDTLKEALILAQKTADETRASAHKEADLIVQETRQKCFDIEKKAHDDLSEVTWELQTLKQQKKQYLERFRRLIEDQLAIITSAADPQEEPTLIELNREKITSGAALVEG